MRLVSWIGVGPAIIASLAYARTSFGAIASHAVVSGGDVADAEVRGPSIGAGWKAARWADLASMKLDQGTYQVRLKVAAGIGVDAIELPTCAGKRGGAAIDGARLPASEGARVVALGEGAHEIVFDVNVSSYEHRIACGAAPRLGLAMTTRGNLGVMTFESPSAKKGGGRAVVYVPPGHDWAAPGTLLVGAHPWNGDIWTYASYGELLREARARDVVLLMPSGLGNSLYVAEAEDEVMRAIDQIGRELAIDPRAVSIWGASMGGAGATTIGFHRPDRFASITSYFGDSQYDVTTYVSSVLPDDARAHTVNALDIVDNARNVPVWLIHGDADKVSPIAQSEMLERAMRTRQFKVRFDRVAGRGHEGEVVTRWIAEVVAKASEARVPDVTRVTYWSVRPDDVGAYGVTIVRQSPKGDAFVDIEKRADAVHVRKAMGVRTILLARGALGAPDGAAIVIDDGSKVEVRSATR